MKLVARTSVWFLAVAALAAAAGCDSVGPVDESQLVVEGFLDSGRPLAHVRVHRTLAPNTRYDADEAAVTDASVEVALGETTIRYAPDSGRRGLYRPDRNGFIPQAGQPYSFRASWKGNVAEASGTIPPEVAIADVSLSVPDVPVSAVLLDSLALSDSLSTGLYTGYIYPVEVTVQWNEAAAEGWSPSDSWIRAQLKPFAAFSSPVVDLFLRSEEIFREGERSARVGRRSWRGIYAVGVTEADDPMPEHHLRVSLLRSGPDYARFAASKDAPERREPITNLAGAVGIFAAVSVDSTLLYVVPNGASHGVHRKP